jgi:hypothetical protein
MKTHIDEHTGREIHVFTDLQRGCIVDYFRLPRRLPDHRIIAFTAATSSSASLNARGTIASQPYNLLSSFKMQAEDWQLVLVDPDSGDTEALDLRFDLALKLRESDGRLWVVNGNKIQRIDLPDGDLQTVTTLPPDCPGNPVDITCDGRTLLLSHHEDDQPRLPAPDFCDADWFWNLIERPRSGVLYAFDIETQVATILQQTDGTMPMHVDSSPVDPTLIRYCWDGSAVYDQRVWAARTDGSRPPWKIRPQANGELVAHEFWWPDGELIAYKFQDRRNDPTVRECPYAEYSPCPTQLCLADRDGREVYCSDPVNMWHSHINVSPNCRYVSGEGSHDHLSVYVAAFDIGSTNIDFVPLATIHTPYLAFAGNCVNAGFSADSRWLIYNDTIDGTLQVCAVAVDL